VTPILRKIVSIEGASGPADKAIIQARKLLLKVVKVVEACGAPDGVGGTAAGRGVAGDRGAPAAGV
jgi:hypothetical protein